MEKKIVIVVWILVLIVYVFYNLFYEMNIVPFIIYLISNGVLFWEIKKRSKNK